VGSVGVRGVVGEYLSPMGRAGRLCHLSRSTPHRERITVVAQTILSPENAPTTTPADSDDASANSVGGHSTLTLWLFGLTAMTLVFASLLIFGLLARSGTVDSAVTTGVSVYAVLTASIGLAALAYVLTMSRRAGLFGSHRTENTAWHSVPDADDLTVAPTVLPDSSSRLSREQAQAREARRHRARAITTAAASGERQWAVPPSAKAEAAVASVPVTKSKAVPQKAVWPPRMPQPTSASPPRRPVSEATPPVQGQYRHGGAPAYLRMKAPAAMPRVQPAAFQVMAASLPKPFWDRPYNPTIADRLLGRGTYQAALRAGVLPPAPPSVLVPVHAAARH
jgi:hypothetical protein